jgi:hypothetical protein
MKNVSVAAACLLILAGFAVPNPARALWFDGPIVSETTRGYTFLEVGDVNNDGAVDVVARPTTSGLDVYLNDGDGHFTLSQALPTSQYGYVLVDEDRDGYLDILAGHNIYRNDGTGNLTFEVGLTGAWGAPYTVGDVTQDAIPDLIAFLPEFLVIFRGAADHIEFSTPILINLRLWPDGIPEDTFPHDVDICDLNGDGLNDIVVGGETFREDHGDSPAILRWVLAAPGGGFSTPYFSYFGMPGSAFETIATGDVDGDGVPDIVGKCTGLDDMVFLYDAIGNAFTAGGDPFNLPYSQAVQLADIDTDGILDAVLFNDPVGYHFKGYVFQGRGNGLFRRVQDLDRARWCGLGARPGNRLDVFSVDYEAGIRLGTWYNVTWPAAEALSQPFHEGLRIAPTVAEDRTRITTVSRGDVAALDATGRLVRRWSGISGSVDWDMKDATGRELPAGVYWIRFLRDDGSRSTRRVIRLR